MRHARLCAGSSAALAAACFFFHVPPAKAAYPDRPVRLVVPSPPGGGTDATTRMIAPKLSEALGQNFVIDNRGGAAGNIGAEIVLRAPPDGYTLLAAIASLTSNPYVMRQVSYDLERDFAPISRTVVVPNVLVVHPSVHAQTTKELIALAKARPGELRYASASIGSAPHLMMALFCSMAGISAVHVPYKGAGPALIDVTAGHVQMMAANILSTLPLVKSGRLRALGVTSAKRSSAAPEIPAIAETLPGYEAAQWFGLLAPAGTPSAIVRTLHAAVLRVLSEPSLKQRFEKEGADPLPSASPDEFRDFIRAESRKWRKVVKDANIQPE